MQGPTGQNSRAGGSRDLGESAGADPALAADRSQGLLPDLVCPRCAGSPTLPGQNRCPWQIKGRAFAWKVGDPVLLLKSGFFAYQLGVL